MALPASALLDPSLVVTPAPAPWLERSPRFTEGPEHDRARGACLAVLPPVEGLRERSRALTGDGLRDDLDIMPLALTVPVAVLAAAMGVAGTVDLDGDPGLDDAVAALLWQCRDATAALVAARLVGDDGPPVVLTRRVDPAGAVHDVLLDAAPFGDGPHACPGRAQAEALADGMLDALAGWHVVAVGPLEDRPNLRLPSSLRMAR